jgi:hypothetical protein
MGRRCSQRWRVKYSARDVSKVRCNDLIIQRTSSADEHCEPYGVEQVAHDVELVGCPLAVMCMRHLGGVRECFEALHVRAT